MEEGFQEGTVWHIKLFLDETHVFCTDTTKNFFKVEPIDLQSANYPRGPDFDIKRMGVLFGNSEKDP